MSDLTEKKKHLEALEEFLASPAHIGYIVAVEQEIREVTDSIIAIVPDSLENFVEQLQLRGELRLLQMEVKRFEDAARTLKGRIDEMAEAELENATQVR